MRDDHHQPIHTDPSATGRSDSAQCQTSLEVRLLATTDLHMQLLGHDYIRDEKLPHHGLAGLATLIAQARAQAQARNMACLLFDNGDLLQGAALGTVCAALPVDQAHPIVASLNTLSYDAIGLGNHDLDHGLAYPQAIAQQLSCPVIASNLSLTQPGAFAQAALLTCNAPRPSSTNRTPAPGLRIGVLSLLPDKTSLWNRQTLKGRGTVLPARATLANVSRSLRAQGADVIVLLAHMGVEDILHDMLPSQAEGAENGPRDFDAIIAGHTHRRLPGRDHAGLCKVDEIGGALADRPAIMPGFDGSDLAVLDLSLARTGDGPWQITGHRSQLRQNTGTTAAHPAVTAALKPVHDATRTRFSHPVGHVDRDLHNFFSLIVPTNTCALLARAKYMLVRDALTGTADQALPLLAASSAHTAGGRAGPDNYLHIPKGPLLQRHLAGLNPFANEICGLRVTGADLRAWLEHAAGIFHHLDHTNTTQPLYRADRPAFDFDTIFGLDYSYDLTRRPGARLAHLRYKGRDVPDTQRFILATTTFRAAGGGGGAQFPDNDIACLAQKPLSEVFRVLLGGNDLRAVLTARPWRFDLPQPMRTIVRTAPAALNHLHDIARFAPVELGPDSEGFTRLQLTL